MSNLITIIDNEPFTDSFALAEGTGNEHRAILQLIRKYTNDLKTFGRVAFEMRPFETSGGKQKRELANLNELQSALILSYMRNTAIVRKFKMALVKGFFDAREKLRNGFNPATLSKMDILRLAMDAEEEKQKLVKQIELDKPKVEFAQRHASATGNFCLRDAAKQVGYPPNAFNRWLYLSHYMFRQGGKHWMPYADSLKRGFMEIKVGLRVGSDGEEKATQQCRITSKGVQHFEKRLIKEGLIKAKEFELV